MNLKRALTSIVVLSIFITGCSNKPNLKDKNIKDEINQQKTMTKVQNDITEIMNKDYEYVLKNMGTPYCTTYYIDKEKMHTIEDVNKVNNIRLIYPKYTAQNELEGSALYIELSNNKVNEVQTYEFSNYDIEKENVGKDIDIIIDKYENELSIPLKKIESIKFDNYIGKNKEELYEIVKDNTPNAEAYYKNANKSIQVFFLEDDKNEITKVLAISLDKNKVEKIKIVNTSEIMDLVKENLNN